MQAYLEAEPATRTTKDEYVMRYQRFAKSGLEQALKTYATLHSSIGIASCPRFEGRQLQTHHAVRECMVHSTAPCHIPALSPSGTSVLTGLQLGADCLSLTGWRHFSRQSIHSAEGVDHLAAKECICAAQVTQR